MHHIVEGLRVHHVVEVVGNFYGSVAAQVAVGLSVSHIVVAGEGGDEQYDVLGYVFDAKHGQCLFGHKVIKSFQRNPSILMLS